MSDEYTRAVLKKVVAQICLTIGWNSIHTTPLEVMVDLLHRFIVKITQTASCFSQEFGSSPINLASIDLAFQHLGIRAEDLSEYIQNVESVPCVDSIPKYPVARDSHLNFLKPGSREVVTRPVHVHEHLPPMYPEMEEEESEPVALSVDTGSTSVVGNSPLSSPKGGGVFKRPGEPPSLEHPAVKRARQMLEEEGRPLREISSVMMTTSGFLSPAREGKLPESRTPVLNDPGCYSPASSTSSYPMVPPEVKGEKKNKKNSLKKNSDGQKKMEERAFKKAVDKHKGGAKTEKNNHRDESKVKKLASMKEFAKLKALKSGAMKLLAQGNASALPSMSAMGKIPKISTPKMSSVKSPKGKKLSSKSSKGEKSTAPHLTIQQLKSGNPSDKIKDFSLVIEKLSSEPDKQKLNIFKKISKKEDKIDRVETLDVATRDLHDSFPGQVGDETEASRGMRVARMAQIDHCIESVIMRSLEADMSSAAVGTTPIFVDSDSDRSRPPTPDSVSSLRKTDAPPERKKKRERSKSRKEKSKSPKSSPISSPQKIKVESVEPHIEIPEVLDTRTSVFPFFTHFPPAPGLIPPPIGHPLFPRFNLPLGKNMPHPAMPNMSLPPALFMHAREELPGSPPEKPLPQSPLVVVEPEQPREKTPPPLAQQTPHFKDKVGSEKKSKEHKKDKKEKDKTKKKKDKKERMKAKAEKRKNKEEKKERDKEKMISKKEKKEKRKEKEREREKEHEKKREKEREEKSEGSVPKITFRLGLVSPDVPPRKITIKPVTKKSSDPEDCEDGKRAPSPELARISALITRPPKPKSTSKGGSDTCDLPFPDASTRPHSIPPLDPASKVKKHVGKPYAKVKGKLAKGDVKDIVPAFYHDKDGNKVWICPACGRQDDGSPMIGCDDCDAWYHWVCVGIQVPPDENEDWYCRVCIVKKQEHYVEKGKKKRKKKQSSPN